MLISIALLFVACGKAPTSPSTLRPPASQRPAGTAVTIRGEVIETTSFPIAGAEVQVVTGPSAGTKVLADRYGIFTIGLVAAGSETLRASKEGFQTSERSVSTSVSCLRFELPTIDMPVVITGTYDLTVTAANECTQLPNAARQRTYRAQLDPAGAGLFIVALLNGDFPYGAGGNFGVKVRRESPRTLRFTFPNEYYSDGLVERLGPEMLLEIIGSVDVPLGAGSAAVPFEGTFAFCAAAAYPDEIPYRCHVQPVTCRSTNHRLTWMRN